MLLPNGETLKHGSAPYDPVKAHEYYVRTRHLKGRKKGSDYTVTTEYGRTETLTATQLTEQKVYAAHRVSSLQSKLSDLNAKLKQKIAEAAKTSTKTSKPVKPETAAQKLKRQQDAKKYKASHKTQLKNKAKAAQGKKSSTTKSTTKSDPVTNLRYQIAVTRGKLLAAVAKQRTLAAAKKNG